MNIENLRAFLEVIASGSFQKASENLHITQSSVSARIKALEDRLNRQLFTRKPQGVVLTAGGQVFQRHAQSVIKAWERAQQETALPDGLDSSVTLGIPANLWQCTASYWLNWMQQQAPNVATQLQSDASQTLMAQLRDGLLDIAILYQPQQLADMVVEPYRQETLILASTTERSVEEGRTEGYIYIDWGQAFRDQHNQAYPGVPHHRLSVSQQGIALEHILSHGGSAYFNQLSIAHLQQQQRLYPVIGAKEITLTSYLVCTKERLEDEAVQLAIAGLRTLSKD